MNNFRITDKHILFASDVAAGKDQYQAYIDHLATRKDIKKEGAKVQSSKLINRPEMKQLIEKIRKEKTEALVSITARQVAKEFKTVLLETEELDAYHCAIIQGMVEVEEVVPVYTYEDVLNEKGQVIKRIKKPSFMKVKRPPNIREKQISIDAIYKRRGNYAPAKLFGAFGNVNDETGDIENVERFVILSTGEKIPL